MEKYGKFLGKSFLALILLSFNQSVVFAHHVGVEIMGKEYEPQGVVQHVLCIVIVALFITFAVYGFVTFIKKFLPQKSRQSKTATEEGYSIVKPE